MAYHPIDDLPIPAFLQRKPGDAKAPPLKPKKWAISESIKKQMARDAKRKVWADARTPVLLAVQDRQDTVGKIRKATGLDAPVVQAALRRLIKMRQISKIGRHYFEF